MAQETEPIKDTTKCKLPNKVVGTIKYRIGVVKVTPCRVSNAGMSKPKISHGVEESAKIPLSKP